MILNIRCFNLQSTTEKIDEFLKYNENISYQVDNNNRDWYLC